MSPTATVEPTALGELRPLLELVPSPLNPRTHFDKTKLEELAASIKSKGIIEPLIVRSRAGLGQLEIVAGERRYRAAKLAGHDVVPVIIRTLSDVEVLELMAIENSQRDDLHPLEEAAGYDALMKADRAYTPEAIAAKIGKSKRYVQQRLQLSRLDPSVKKAFFDDRITAGHADLLSRLTPEDQKAGLKACFDHLFGEEADRGCISVRKLDTWIENNIRIELSTDDPQTAFLPELASTLATLDTAKILQVAGGYLPKSVEADVLKTALPADAYRRINGKKDHCTFAQRAVIIIGDGRGKFIDVCTANTKCKTHWQWEIDRAARDRTTRTATKAGKRATQSPQAAAADKKAKEKRQAEEARRGLRAAVIEQIATRFEKVATNKPVAALVPVLLAVIPTVGRKSPNTWKGVAVAAVAILCDDCFGEEEYKTLGKLLKPLGVDIAALERGLTPKPAQTSASKKANG